MKQAAFTKSSASNATVFIFSMLERIRVSQLDQDASVRAGKHMAQFTAAAIPPVIVTGQTNSCTLDGSVQAILWEDSLPNKRVRGGIVFRQVNRWGATRRRCQADYSARSALEFIGGCQLESAIVWV